jgi:molecular chaperone DnaK (HSP70)
MCVRLYCITTTAAALAYGLDKADGKLIAVFDLGESSRPF